MNKIIVLAIAALALTGCSAPDRSRRVLRDQGYSNINITGYEWLGCGEDDTYSTGFTAKGPTGRNISGVVCCGLIGKSCTVRTD